MEGAVTEKKSAKHINIHKITLVPNINPKNKELTSVSKIYQLKEYLDRLMSAHIV